MVNSPRLELIELAGGAGKLNHPLRQGPHMLRAGTALRFTPAEVEEFRSLGLDFDGARTQDDVEQSLAAWAQLLSDERPDLLERIVAEMAKAKGVKTPPKLALMVSADAACGSPRRS